MERDIFDKVKDIIDDVGDKFTDPIKDMYGDHCKTKEKEYEAEKDIFKDNAKEYTDYKKKEQEEKTKRHKETCETILKGLTIVGGIAVVVLIGMNNTTLLSTMVFKNDIV